MSKLMTIEQLEKRLKLCQRKADALNKKYSNNRYRYQPTKMKYKKTLQVFSGGNNLQFNPLNGLGFSYRWYEISKLFGKTLVLNNYSYSSTTIKHVAKLRTLFGQLGLEYIEVSAPNGLHNLDSAMIYHTEMLAHEMVADKYARIKTKNVGKFHKDAIQWLSRHVSKHGLSLFLESAELNRRSKLDRLKEKRAEQKAKELTNQNITNEQSNVVQIGDSND